MVLGSHGFEVYTAVRHSRKRTKDFERELRKAYHQAEVLRAGAEMRARKPSEPVGARRERIHTLEGRLAPYLAEPRRLLRASGFGVG